MRITDDESLRSATAELLRLDRQAIGAMMELAGPPPLRRREAGLAGLVRIVIGQQVSVASADAINSRFEKRFPAVIHGDVLAAPVDDLQTCGLSRPKIATIRNICSAIDEGTLDLALLEELPLEEARSRLVAIKGIGPWTADIYFLFCLGHPDVLPAGDLALQEGVRMALGLRQRPDAARLEQIARRWQPWRAVAARIIWAYYGAIRNRATETGPASARPARKRAAEKAGRATTMAEKGKA